MKALVALLAALSLVGCETPTSTSPSAPTAGNAGGLRPAGPRKAVSFGGGNGSSYKKAIVVHASDEKDGVHAEYEYIRAHFPGSRFKSQALAFENGKAYDIMTFADAAGKKQVLYFDISEYFGRM